MKKDDIIKKLIVAVIIIYIIFLFTDIGFRNVGNCYSTILKFSSIILCFFIVLLIGNDGIDKMDKSLVQLARFFTVLADLFLVILNNFQIGIGCFCIVQFIYILRHGRGKAFKNTAAILLVTIAIASLIYIKVPIPNIDKSMYIVALLYASLLINSVIMAATTYSRKVYSKFSCTLIAVGMILFFMCDFNVALYNLIDFYDIELIRVNNKEFLVGFLMWFFYLPSQLLLTLSGFNENYIKKLFG
jgi:hypothetical protein